MKKKILVLSLCVFFLAGCGKIPVLKNGEEAVVTFEKGEAISVDDLYAEMKNNYAIATLIDMIDAEILAKEYKDETEDKVTYVKNYIEAFKANFEDDATYSQAMKYYYGANDENELEEVIGLYYLKDLATTDYAKTLISNKDIKNYYKNTTKGDIKCSHILIAIDTDENMNDNQKAAAKEKALNEAKALIKELEASKNVSTLFATLAKEKSDDTASAKDGGDLGYFNIDEMYDEFEKAAYALKKGEYTKTPVETTAGYHIILKVDEKEKPSLEKAKDAIITTLAEKKKEDEATIQVDALTKLRKTYGFKIEDSELNKQYSTYIKNLISSLNTQ